MNGKTVKWQTGKGHAFNYECLVTVHDSNGKTYVDTDFWNDSLNEWTYHNKYTGSEVIAWCKIKDIEPYKIKEE